MAGLTNKIATGHRTHRAALAKRRLAPAPTTGRVSWCITARAGRSGIMVAEIRGAGGYAEAFNGPTRGSRDGAICCWPKKVRRLSMGKLDILDRHMRGISKPSPSSTEW